MIRARTVNVVHGGSLPSGARWSPVHQCDVASGSVGSHSGRYQSFSSVRMRVNPTR